MIIKYTNYSDGVHYVELKKSAAKLNLSEPFNGDVLLNCKMDKSISQIVFDCEVKANAELSCDRCAKDFIKELSNKFQIIYLFSKDEVDEEELNVHYLSPESDKIDLSNDAIEFCKLSIPLKVLCDDNCKGLCPSCGTDLNEKECDCSSENINPIWDKLKKLKD